jgi:HEAT repeat protein
VGISYRDRLVWALAHPLTGRQMVALDALARIRDPGCWEPVRRLLDSPDPYLAAAALRTLAEIDPAKARLLVEHYRAHGHVLLRRAAAALAGAG